MTSRSVLEMEDAITKQITQLEAARRHVLSDAVHYSVIIPGILPIIGPNAHLEIRRWGTEFLAEGFASPQLALHAKEALSVQVLQLLRDLLESPTEDEYVLKSVIQTAASIYGLIFRHMYVLPHNCRAPKGRYTCCGTANPQRDMCLVRI